MDIWTEQAIANLACATLLPSSGPKFDEMTNNLLGYDVQRMVDLWEKWGGVPSTLMTYLDDSDQLIENWYRRRAKTAIRECQNMLRVIMGNRLPEDSDVPLRFYFCPPADYATSSIDRTGTCATVPTHTICNIVAEALDGLSNAIKSEFFTALSQRNGTREAAGFIYQAWFHYFFSTANKSIDCHWLGEQDNVTKLCGAADLVSESAMELNTKKERPYYWPATSGYPGISGVLICDNAIFAFQMIISPTHASPEPGVRKLREQLPANLKNLPWRVVFVGHMESSSKAVARQWVGKVFLMNTSQTAVPIA